MKFHRRRFLGYFLAWGFIAFIGRAEEASVKPVDDPLAATRKELQDLKNERLPSSSTGVLSSANAMETMVIPPLLAPNPMPARARAPAELSTKPKSSNWLVDAMQKDKQSGAQRRSHTENDQGGARLAERSDKRDSSSALPGENLAEDEVNSKETESPRENRSKPSAEKPPENPLSRFMGEWLTPHDYEMLKKSPGPAEEFPATVSGEIGTTFLPDSIRLLPVGAASTGFGGENLLPTKSGIPTENPYLAQASNFASQALTGRPADDSVLRNPAQSPPPTSPRPIESFVPPPPSTTSSPFIPDNLKRADDAKYFPQLKRF